MRTRIRPLAAAAVLALALTACQPADNTSTGGTSGGNNGDVHQGGTAQPCEATFKPAGDVTGITTGGSVKGTLWVRCSTPPTEHHLTLILQRFKVNNWADVETKTIDKIPAEIWQPMLVTTSCVPGKWRLHWAVVGTLQGQSFAGSAIGEPYDVKASDCA